MALLNNYTVFTVNPLFTQSGQSVSDNPVAYNQSGMNRNQFYGECVVKGVTETAGYPNGYRPPYSWCLPPKNGSVAMNWGAKGYGYFTNANLAGGLNAVTTMAGSGTISSAALGLIVSAAITIAGTSGLTASAIGALNASITLAGQGGLTASLGALAGAVMTIIGSGSLSGTSTGIASASANITPYTALSPESLAAQVWNSVAATFNTAGTMGNKLNSAASSGDPWSSPKALTVNKFLALK